jgi:Ser/Thr protein kinase RdoA (MazF antagonist)
VGDSRTIEAVVSVDGRYAGTAPRFTAEPRWWPDVEHVTARLDALLGSPTAVLRLVGVDDPVTGYGGRVTYHVTAPGVPDGVLDPSPRDDWPAITEPHPLRTAWAEPDGPRRLLEWAVQHVEPTGPPVQVKTWNLSCVYRIPTADGPVWLKATSPFMRHDAAVIELVSRYDARLAPAVIASDPVIQRSLLAHAPGVDCFETDTATIRAVLARWVRVQAALADEPVPSWLPQLGDLTERLRTLLDGEVAARLDPDGLAAAHRLADDLPRLVAELDTARLPLTLVHGDFHSGNWRSDGTAQTIVDWADTYHGHPAHDALRLISWIPDEQRPVAEQTWAAAWREAWPDSEPERALAPMAVLLHVVNALVYQRFLDNIEPAERVYHEDDPTAEVRRALETWNGCPGGSPSSSAGTPG